MSHDPQILRVAPTVPTLSSVVIVDGVGDGVTDDTNAFYVAHNALPSSGGIIFVPPPSIAYKILGTLIYTKDNLQIVGLGGRSSTYMNFYGASGIGFDIRGSNNVVENLVFQGAAGGNLLDIVKLSNSNTSHFSNCLFISGGSSGCRVYNCQDCTFEHCVFTSNPGAGFYFDPAALSLNGRISVSHSIISANGYGIYGPPQDFDCMFFHNNIGLNTIADVYIVGSCQGFSLDHNTIECATLPTNPEVASIVFKGISLQNGPSIINNTISYSRNHADAITLIYMDYMKYPRIDGNRFIAQIAQPSSVCIHITATCVDLVRTNNGRATNLSGGTYLLDDGSTTPYSAGNRG